MSIRTKALSRALKSRVFRTPVYDVSTNLAAQIIAQIPWSARFTKAKFHCTTAIAVGSVAVNVGYAAYGADRTAADTDYFVDSDTAELGDATKGEYKTNPNIIRMMKVGRSFSLHLDKDGGANKVIRPGEVITLTTTKAGSATGNGMFEFFYEFEDYGEDQGATWGTAYTTTSSSTSTSTSTSTTSA